MQHLIASYRGMLVSLVCQPDATTPELTYQELQGNTYVRMKV